jgi:hypothetical protein
MLTSRACLHPYRGFAVSSRSQEWITRRQAKRLGLSDTALDRAIADRRVSTRRVPGMRPTLLRGDVEALIAGSTNWATEV